mmetsp:Transcript_41990/g.98377  ORF Transcript_41990/g.98377 Transcript_41990/m.98377 type:complete len:555 (-) Transcript_41990:2458-4122(-)
MPNSFHFHPVPFSGSLWYDNSVRKPSATNFSLQITRVLAINMTIAIEASRSRRRGLISVCILILLSALAFIGLKMEITYTADMYSILDLFFESPDSAYASLGYRINRNPEDEEGVNVFGKGGAHDEDKNSDKGIGENKGIGLETLHHDPSDNDIQIESPVVAETGIMSNELFFAFVNHTLSASDAHAPPVLNLTKLHDPLFHARSIGRSLGRAYQKRNSSTWCFPTNSYRTPIGTLDTNVGLLYVKTPKAASSTIAGVVMRISSRHGSSMRQCREKHDHIRGSMYAVRDRSQSFLLTSLRDPTARAISRVFFTRISAHGNKPSDNNIIRYLNDDRDPQRGTVGPGTGGFQMFYLSTAVIEKWIHYNKQNEEMVVYPALLRAYVKNIVDSYDFIVVVERMDESLVALQLLMGLDPTDILYANAKTAGSYTYHKKSLRKKCYLVQKSIISDTVRAYLDGTSWIARNYGDFILHAAADASLDATIESLGRHQFEEALKNYQELKARADKMCSPFIKFPCSLNGTLQDDLARENCYEKDAGCGYPCFDRLVMSHKQSV